MTDTTNHAELIAVTSEHQCCAAVEEARNLLFRRGMPRWLKIAKLHELLSVVAR